MHRFATRVFAAFVVFLMSPAVQAATLPVPSMYTTVQEAIVAATAGDVVDVAPGVHVGNIDFLGKSVTVVGRGYDTILQGTGQGSVVRFASGEANGAVIDSVVIRGGNTTAGGGIFIDNASPTIVRTVVIDNAAVGNGSGIVIGGAAAAPLIFNNVFAYNVSAGGDPHTIEVNNGSRPSIVNNTIVRGDSNAIITRGLSAPLIMNNILAFNGSFTEGARRGRGICDFAFGGASVIAYNNFQRNRVAALLRDGRDWGRVTLFQRLNPNEPNIHDNNDGRPGFARRPPRRVEDAIFGDFVLVRSERKTAAIDAGNPNPACNDLDGTRNDAGAGGGPFAAGNGYPTFGDCGVLE